MSHERTGSEKQEQAQESTDYRKKLHSGTSGEMMTDAEYRDFQRSIDTSLDTMLTDPERAAQLRKILKPFAEIAHKEHPSYIPYLIALEAMALFTKACEKLSLYKE